MEITVALDGEKKRDLRFFAGDDMSLTIVVYEHDGDVSPIVVSNVRFAAADGSLPMDSEFVVPSNFFGRVPYRIVGEVEDITTTLAYGVMQTEGGWPSLFCWCSGSPWPYGIVGKADNITVLDAHANFDGTVSVEGALQELGDFKKSVGDISAAVETATEAAESASEDAAYVAAQLPNLLTKPEASATDGATKIGTPTGTVQAALDARPTSAALVADDGSVLGAQADGVGATLRDQHQKNQESVSFLDYMTDAERADALLATPLLDHTVSMQKAIDANKGGRIVGPKPCTFQAAGLTVNGATYDGTEIVFEGEFLLKQRPTSGSTTYQGAWVGLLFKDVSRASLTFRGNGQRAVQPDEEHIYMVGLAGAKNMSIPAYTAREIRGDGLYISQSDWTATSSNTDGLTIGTFEVSNTAADGRNGLSLVSGDNVSIAAFRTNNVGALVGGVTQPGGFDIEPNHSGQSCKNITVESVNVVTAGTTGLAIHGILGADVTRNVKIASANIVNTCAPSVNDGLGNLTQTQNFTLKVQSTADVSIADFHGQFTNAYGDGMALADSARLYVQGAVRHVREGVRIGNDAIDDSGGGAGVVDSYINVSPTDISRFGIRTGKIIRTKITGKVSAPVAGFYTSIFGVISFTHAQTNCEYSVSVAESATWTRSYRNDPTTPATYANTVIRDCDLSGSTWAGFTNQVGDMQMIRINVRGVTDRASIPSVGTNLWLAGQLFTNSAATALGTATGWVFDGAAMQPTGYRASVTALPTYTMTGSVLRTGNSATMTLVQVGDVLTTLIADLRARGLLL